MMKYAYGLFVVVLIACGDANIDSAKKESGIIVSHGPMLGHITSNSVRVWARTKKPGSFELTYQKEGAADAKTVSVETKLEDDNAAWIVLDDLEASSVYSYSVGSSEEKSGTFRTLPAMEQFLNQHNPKGLFNFSFEFGSCASQNPKNGIGPSLPTYNTMLEKVRGEVDFAVMNGDWLYEEKRDYPPKDWAEDQGLELQDVPKVVKDAPTVVGVWENYKNYLDRAKNLAEWHRHVPSYYTFDDHELINDLWGAGSVGRRDRRTVFRDIGTAAWYDYLGWANPTNFDQKVHFGTATFKAGSDVIVDEYADFTKIDWKQAANLHVHWGTSTAGVDQISLDVDSTGVPNARVYEVVEVLDANRIRISPSPVADGESAYSIGRRSYARFTVANSDFFLLDTRTHREYHDTQMRDKPGLTILGYDQRDWLMEEMKNSEADFFFLFSSVPFMIPHIGAGGYEANSNKDESWTVFLDEREKLISFWEELGKPVFVLTGDLHNSFAVKITDHIWEFCAGPHNSVNHRLSDEGDRPKSGLYQFDKREMDIRWSSFVMDDIPRSERMYPHYCVVQINNVFNNPLKLGEERWIPYEHPQVIFQYYDGRTGDFRYSETISTKRKNQK